MYSYSCEPDQINIKGYCNVEVEGRDLDDHFYRFIDELLFSLCGEPHLLVRKVQIIGFDEVTFLLRAICFGECFDPKRHGCERRLESILKTNIDLLRNLYGFFEVCYTIET